MDRRDQNPVLRVTILSSPRFPRYFISSTQDMNMQDRRCVLTEMMNDGQRMLGQSALLCELVGGQRKGRSPTLWMRGEDIPCGESEAVTTKSISARLAGGGAGLEQAPASWIGRMHVAMLSWRCRHEKFPFPGPLRCRKSDAEVMRPVEYRWS
jgi:hypothetical protein